MCSYLNRIPICHAMNPQTATERSLFRVISRLDWHRHTVLWECVCSLSAPLASWLQDPGQRSSCSSFTPVHCRLVTHGDRKGIPHNLLKLNGKYETLPSQRHWTRWSAVWKRAAAEVILDIFRHLWAETAPHSALDWQCASPLSRYTCMCNAYLQLQRTEFEYFPLLVRALSLWEMPAHTQAINTMIWDYYICGIYIYIYIQN